MAKHTAKQEPKKTEASCVHKFLYSDQTEYRCFKALFGILSGLFAGGILYVLLVYSFNFDYIIAAWVTLGNTVIICIGLAASMWFRCVLLLLLPSLFTGRGRVALLAVIFGMLLAGPATNIKHNATQVARTMSCTSEMIYNQSQMLRHQLEEPIKDIARKIQTSMEKVQKVGEEIQDALKPFTELLDQFGKKVKEASNYLKNLVRTCDQKVNEVRQKCINGINKVKRDCERELDRIDPTDDIVDFGKDVGNTFNDIGSSISGIFGRRRRSTQRKTCDWLHPWQTALRGNRAEIRNKRGVLSKACSILDVSALCEILKVGTGVCRIAGAIGDVVTGAAYDVGKILDTVANFFVFGIEASKDLSGGINSSQSAAQIMMKVQADIAKKTEIFDEIAVVMKYVLSVPLLFLFIRSALYIQNFRTKDYFDNNYVSQAFKSYDDRRQKMGKPSVLPLKKKERRKYIDTRSLLLSPIELKIFKSGGITVMLHLLIAGVIITADYVLFYILTVLKKFGNANVSITGGSVVHIDILGNGFIAKILGAMVSGINVESDFDVDFNITQCLPNPYEPKFQNLFVLGTLYIVAFIFIFTQAYGLRMRRKIAAYFYPEQEFERIQYLHEKIRLKRKSIIAWLFQNMKSRRKQNAVSKTVGISAMMYYRCPKLASCCCDPSTHITTCLSCSETYNGITEFHVCTTVGCDGVYCINCFVEMNKKCAICRK